MILDTSIRICVFLPTLLMAFLVGYIIKNVKYLTRNEKELKLDQFELNQAIKRSILLLENACYLTKESFSIRKYFFNDKETGYFYSDKLKIKNKNEALSMDELRMVFKSNIIDLFPMIAIAGLNNWMFSGFITTELPFPVTLRFKSMLQRDIEMTELDASWVSSISWYFICIMGFRYLTANVFGNEDPDLQLGDEVLITSKDEIKKAWEDIEIYKHHWRLEDIDVLCD